jgi:thioredoxin 1
MVLDLNPENYAKEVNESDKPVLVDFWAPWCPPCKLMIPLFTDLSKDFEDRVKFAKLNSQDHPEIAQQNNVTGIPCLILFKDGKEAGRIVGLKTKDALKNEIEAML